ncbi:hypothetical protein J2129_001310 [Methanofollis sp. W23]|uniref:hypothetical protein n=1 Tax=Methanofollis sp. W23 TaxID=2817849 RepID=UPI001AE3A6B1|nr:hypothetical protein [Methanofollis sp. W23]MBP2145856.1 hypothetical protein [Methanofollis sp. W23]
MDLEKISDEGWIAWTTVAVTVALVFAVLVSLANPQIAGALWPGLLYLFLLAYGYLGLCVCAGRVKAWVEDYLDAMVGKKDDKNLEKASERIEEMGRRIDHIEEMLVKVSE